MGVARKAEIARHFEGRQLKIAVILINCVPLYKRELLLKDRISSLKQGILSFNPLYTNGFFQQVDTNNWGWSIALSSGVRL